MDAYAHLKGLGWRGTGFSLDSGDRGLKKPLLVSFKCDDKGLGAKSQRERQADQWWLRAFDSALKDLGSGKVSTLQQIKAHGIYKGGLYSFFQKGETLEGTFSDSANSTISSSTISKTTKSKTGSKRKRKDEVDDEVPIGKKARSGPRSASLLSDTHERGGDTAEQMPDETPGQRLKGIDGILITPPDSLTKKKKECKEPARKRRLREEPEQKERNRMARLKAKAEAMKDPNFDWEMETRDRIESQIKREVKAEIRKRQLTEEFGPVLPSAAELLQMEKEADKLGPEKFSTTKLAALSIKVHGPPKDGVYKKVKYKAEKYKRQKLIREARQDLRARLRHKYLGEPYVDESSMTAEEKAARRKAEKNAKRLERRKAHELVAQQEVEEGKIREQKHQEELATKTAETEKRKQTTTILEAMEVAEVAGNAILPPNSVKNDMFAAGADEIKLDINIDGKKCKVPGVGKVDRYPTKVKKREKKLKAEAYENGMTVDQWKAKLERAREELEPEELDSPMKEQVDKLREARGGLKGAQWRRYCILAEQEGKEATEEYFVAMAKANRELEATKAAGEIGLVELQPNGHAKEKSTTQLEANGHAIEEQTPTKPLSEEKQAKYTEKAAKQGMNVEEYVAQKEANPTKISQPEELSKGLEAEISISGDLTQGSNNKFYSDLAEVKAQKASKVTSNVVREERIEETEVGFVVDGVGDPSLRDIGATFVIDDTGDSNILSRQKNTIKWHPDMLGDRKVKELSKAERKARSEWMREKRRERNIALGKNPMSQSERHKHRVERKMRQRDRFVAEILSQQHQPKELVTKAELNDARRQAKRRMRELKREKRNKVIHRKKLGEGLKGTYGGQINQESVMLDSN